MITDIVHVSYIWSFEVVVDKDRLRISLNVRVLSEHKRFTEKIVVIDTTDATHSLLYIFSLVF